jgi:hydrogenase maturation protease
MDQWEWKLLEDKMQLEQVEIPGAVVRKGDRVRLNPKAGGDILDIALRGQTAILESIEEDYEGVQHVCVVLEEDPGRDLGMMRQPGHRFFFSPAELEPAGPAEGGTSHAPAVKPQILIAGIGNIFMGDDAFGVEVVRELMQRNLPAAVRVVDFGIRGLDLAYALQDGYDTTILVDAFPNGQPPGTVTVLEPDQREITERPEGMVDAHSLHPLNVLRMAHSMNGPLKRVLLVGCEPANLAGDEGRIGLSEPVDAALDEAVRATEALVNRILTGEAI